MHCTYTPLTGHIRVFSEGKRSGDPYCGIATIQHLNEDTAYLSGMMGDFNKEAFKALLDKIKELGFSKVIYERAGKKILREL